MNKKELRRGGDDLWMILHGPEIPNGVDISWQGIPNLLEGVVTFGNQARVFYPGSGERLLKGKDRP